MSDAPVVVVTERADLRAGVARLAALAGVEVAVIGASGGLRAMWRTAPAVVVGADLVAAAAQAGLVRRPGVVVVTTGTRDEGLWRATVDLGAGQLLVLPDDDQLLIDAIVDATEPAAGCSAIAVVGGCGGAGASTLAAALALMSARSEATLLVDADPLGGGIDVLVGAETQPGLRWPDLADARGRLGAAQFANSLLEVADCRVLSWGRGEVAATPVDAARAVMATAIRGFSRVVIDLTRHFDVTAEVLLGAADRVILVVPASVRSVAAAATVGAELVARNVQVEVVVRDPGSGRLTVADVAGALRLPIRAELQSEPAVVVAAERGEPPLGRGRGAMSAVCRAILDSDGTVGVAA